MSPHSDSTWERCVKRWAAVSNTLRRPLTAELFPRRRGTGPAQHALSRAAEPLVSIAAWPRSQRRSSSPTRLIRVHHPTPPSGTSSPPRGRPVSLHQTRRSDFRRLLKRHREPVRHRSWSCRRRARSRRPTPRSTCHQHSFRHRPSHHRPSRRSWLHHSRPVARPSVAAPRGKGPRWRGSGSPARRDRPR